jgi:ribosome biogenesis GTPase
VVGFVTGVDRGRYTVRLSQPAPTGAAADVTAVKARELGHRSVVVGDEAHLVGDTSGRAGALARIVRVSPRRTELRRATDEGRGRERVIVANADQMVIVASLAAPPPRPGLIDRQLVAAFDAGLEAAICLTKADLGSAAQIRALYQPLGVRLVETGRCNPRAGADDGGRAGAGAGADGIGLAGAAGADDGGRAGAGAGADGIGLAGLTGLRELLAGRRSVLVGHSGVGKSTLINALVPSAARATGEVNEVTGKGRHTSSSAVALELAGGGWVIDTPGVRSFGLSHVEAGRVLAAFPDLAEIAASCPRACSHEPDSPACALAQWAAGQPGRRARLDSYSRIARSLPAPSGADAQTSATTSRRRGAKHSTYG